MRTAEAYCERAYAPYSNFKVGAALLLEDGSVVGACNVENASYGLSVCAERSAMAAAVAAGLRRPAAVAVAASRPGRCPPCGACRQFLSEFNPEMAVILKEHGVLRTYRLDELLPVRFELEES